MLSAAWVNIAPFLSTQLKPSSFYFMSGGAWEFDDLPVLLRSLMCYCRQDWEGVKSIKTHFISILSDFLHLFYWSAERMQPCITPEHWHWQSTWANWDGKEELIHLSKFDVLMPQATASCYRQTGAEFPRLSYSKYDHKNSHHI